MFESKNMNAVGNFSIVDCVWKTRHEVAAYVFLDDSPTLRSLEDYADCALCVVKKLYPQRCDAALVIPCGLD